jgi:hypothetical protein
MSNFAIYVIGFIILIAGVLFGGHQLGVPQVWLGVTAVILIGIGIISGVSKTRRREAPPDESH